MKLRNDVAIIGFAVLLQAFAPASAVQLVLRNSSAERNPVPKLLGMIQDLKMNIVADGKTEQESYDKYACWCEDTLSRKKKDIANSQEKVSFLQSAIMSLKGQVAAHSAEIEQSQKDINANLESRREATEIRDGERKSYEDAKSESEQCIGALEASTKALTGAGTGKGGFLETMQEAKLLSAAANVRAVMGNSRFAEAASSKDLELVRGFVSKPERFAKRQKSRGLIATQIENNPFGDYAPQSTQIQGILKGMYDTFVADLEKSNGEEATAQKVFEELFATKLREHNTLEATLKQHQLDHAGKNKRLANSKAELDGTKGELAADEELVVNTKEGCTTKAQQWNERSMHRTTELNGIEQAISILWGGDETFENASASLLQLSHSSSSQKGPVEKALAKLRSVESGAVVALQLKTGGHFDQVIASIDMMIANLRKEEKSDIDHRDRCQSAENKNQNDMEDLEKDMVKADQKQKNVEGVISQLKDELLELERELNDTTDDMAQQLTMRNNEVKAFRQSVKDDANAIDLLERAMSSIREFYAKDEISVALVQKDPDDPEDKAPETTWTGADYRGARGETKGVLGAFEMILQDFKQEINTARADDVAAQKAFEKERTAMNGVLKKLKSSQLERKRHLSDAEATLQDTAQLQVSKETDQTSQEKVKQNLEVDCSWVKSHFQKRRDARKVEIDGLVDAKSSLAGSAGGDDLGTGGDDLMIHEDMIHEG